MFNLFFLSVFEDEITLHNKAHPDRCSALLLFRGRWRFSALWCFEVSLYGVCEAVNRFQAQWAAETLGPVQWADSPPAVEALSASSMWLILHVPYIRCNWSEMGTYSSCTSLWLCCFCCLSPRLFPLLDFRYLDLSTHSNFLQKTQQHYQQQQHWRHWGLVSVSLPHSVLDRDFRCHTQCLSHCPELSRDKAQIICCITEGGTKLLPRPCLSLDRRLSVYLSPSFRLSISFSVFLSLSLPLVFLFVCLSLSRSALSLCLLSRCLSPSRCLSFCPFFFRLLVHFSFRLSFCRIIFVINAHYQCSLFFQLIDWLFGSVNNRNDHDLFCRAFCSFLSGSLLIDQ